MLGRAASSAARASSGGFQNVRQAGGAFASRQTRLFNSLRDPDWDEEENKMFDQAVKWDQERENAVVHPAKRIEVEKKLYVIPKPQAVGPITETASSKDISVGTERAHIELGDNFNTTPPEGLFGPFGTLEAPFLVDSAYEERIVGCTGLPYPEDHEVMWIICRKDEITECPYCTQCFQLRDVPYEIREELVEELKAEIEAQKQGKPAPAAAESEPTTQKETST
ncbi:hypothetical protein NDN08_004744 [Rhodosorus marinus]|uniref:Zinc finger CHCC-type domain-containing protein n=1 Tax=Rhodosorus marinus TaxID=101924 RepID=A0AAV8UR74_9RHOD|nr:hypothetical protein NDN08_004744 [Rhodosorus marinus]